MEFSTYSIGRSLGEGSYSEVFEVDGAPLAIKIFNEYDNFIPVEPHILNLNIFNVPTLRSVVYDSRIDTFALVMDLASTDLSKFIKTNRLSNQQKRHFIRTIARSISELHFHGFSHSDVKIYNILIYNAEPYLSDFSISSTFDEIDVECVSSDDYKLPEILSNSFFDKEEVVRAQILRTADSWAFGCLAMLIYLNISRWTDEYPNKYIYSYVDFCNAIFEGAEVVRILEKSGVMLDEEDKILLQEIETKHLSISYKCREWKEFTLGYPINNMLTEISPPSISLDLKILPYYQRRIYNLVIGNTIPENTAQLGIKIFNEYVPLMNQDDTITIISNWQNIYLLVCIDIAVSIYSTRSCFKHSAYASMINCDLDIYKQIYTNFIIKISGCLRIRT